MAPPLFSDWNPIFLVLQRFSQLFRLPYRLLDLGCSYHGSDARRVLANKDPVTGTR